LTRILRRCYLHASVQRRLVNIDLSFGEGRVAKAWRADGRAGIRLDPSVHPALDIVDPVVEKRVRGWVKASGVAALFLWPRPDTWIGSAAAARDPEHSWGALSTRSASAAFRAANMQAAACVRLFTLASDSRVPVIFGHPAGSHIWDVPPLKALCENDDTMVISTDLCQFGVKWRQRVTLLTANLSRERANQLVAVCTGKGVCQRTGQRHAKPPPGAALRRALAISRPFARVVATALGNSADDLAWNRTLSLYCG